MQSAPPGATIRDSREETASRDTQEKDVYAHEAVELLRDHGLRVTPQRVWALAALLASEDHVSAEDLHAYMRGAWPEADRSTIDRTLGLFCDRGLASGIKLGDGRTGYHAEDKARHHHLTCRECGATFEVEGSLVEPLREVLRRQYGFRASLRRLAIRLCFATPAGDGHTNIDCGSVYGGRSV